MGIDNWASVVHTNLPRHRLGTQADWVYLRTDGMSQGSPSSSLSVYLGGVSQTTTSTPS